MESIFTVIYHWFYKILKHKVSEKTAKTISGIMTINFFVIIIIVIIIIIRRIIM